MPVTSPLACALAAGHGEVAKLLIQRGADTSDCLALAQIAARSGLSDILQLLSSEENVLGERCIDGETLLTSAAGQGNLESVRFLLEQGVDINARNMSGDTAVGCVLRCRSCPDVMEIINLLLDFGADIHVKNNRSETPLQIAAQMNVDETVKFLLELGCKANVKDECSYSPLHYTA